MKKLTQFEKFGLMAAIVIACTFFYMKKIYEPQEKNFKKTVETLNKVAGELKSTQVVPMVQVRSELEQARKRKAELDGELTANMVRSGTPQEVTLLLGRVNELMAAGDLSILSLAPAGQERDQMLEISWSRYQISLGGSFPGLLHLLGSLSDLPDAVRVTGLQLQKSGDKGLDIVFNLLI